MLYQRTIVTLATALLTIAGTGYSMAGSSHGNGGGSGGSDPITGVEIDDLVFMREEEKLARDSYIELGDKWGSTIFFNISESEQRHMDALEKLLDKFGITDPVEDESDVGNFDNPKLQTLFNDLMVWGLQSETDGFNVGGAIEEVDILDIQHAIERATNEDIISTYESLLCGSRNHLRAFVRQIEIDGTDYVPFLIDEYTELELEAIYEIIDSAMERDCGNNNRQGKGNSKGKSR